MERPWWPTVAGGGGRGGVGVDAAQEWDGEDRGEGNFYSAAKR